MKKILFIFICLTLQGCVFFPKYHDREQTISLKFQKGTIFTIEGYEPNSTEIEVNRSFNSLNGILSKENFEDKKIEIKSHFTDDKWAQMDILSMKLNRTEPELASSATLLPVKAVSVAACFVVGFPYLLYEAHEREGWLGVFKTPFELVLGGPLIIGYAAVHDIWDLGTLSFPRAVFGNPWYEYDKEIDLTREILTPTPEFEKECYSKKNTFIGNNDCLTCLTEKIAISTEEECNRCSNREWSNFECSLK